jgi:hypothetical protein
MIRPWILREQELQHLMEVDQPDVLPPGVDVDQARREDHVHAEHDQLLHAAPGHALVADGSGMSGKLRRRLPSARSRCFLSTAYIEIADDLRNPQVQCDRQECMNIDSDAQGEVHESIEKVVPLLGHAVAGIVGERCRGGDESRPTA